MHIKNIFFINPKIIKAWAFLLYKYLTVTCSSTSMSSNNQFVNINGHYNVSYCPYKQRLQCALSI